MKYIIQVIAYQLNNGKIAKSGEEVNLGQLNGNAEELINKGFIKAVDSLKKPVRKTAKTTKKE